MNKINSNVRTIVIIVLIVLMMVFCGVRLMKIQIVEGSDFLEQSKVSSSSIQGIQAARGEIVDSEGVPIVANKVGFNIIIEKAFFPREKAAGNDIILRLTKLLKDDGHNWIDSLPISNAEPYQYLDNRESDIKIMKDDNHLKLAVYATASDCMEELITLYEISGEYTKEEQRIIAGVRYEMLLRSFSMSNRYTFAEDVKMDTVAKIKELSYNFPGIDIVEEAIRVYAQGDILPQSIGTIGPIYAEEYAELKEKGYGYNDFLGKSGVEKAMEDYLRGSNGKRQITMSNGVVTSIENIVEAVPGNTVKLTINGEFQRKVDTILANHIDWLHSQEKGKTANAGAIVVLDVKTGAVLAMSNFPTYDINDYINDYSTVANGENFPLINRSIDGKYRPGSTFKTVTSTAAFNEGIIDKSSSVTCNRVYHFYDDIAPTCTGTHGPISLSRAIQVSCNIFFYDVGRRTGIDNISKYAGYYGLGEDLGLEIGGSKGYLANPSTFERINQPWTPGQVLQASIGQSEIAVTPLQMAVQAATLANKGVRLKPYMVEGIYSYDMASEINKTPRTVANVIDVKDPEMYAYIEEGMIGAAANTPAAHSLNTLPFKAAIKTGTPQKTGDITSSAFIGYYPVGNPEIAFAGIVEEGEYSKYMIRDIIDAYYGYDKITPPVNPTVTTSPTTSATTSAAASETTADVSGTAATSISNP